MEHIKQLASELKGCEALEEAHAVIVLIREDVDTSVIEETMQTVRCLGRVRVRSRIFNSQQNRYLVLCECKEVVKGEIIPFEVSPIEGGGPWSLIIADEASRCCTQFLMSGSQQSPGTHVEDLRTLFPEDEAAAKSTEAILRAVSDLLDKTSKSSSEHGCYRSLRTLSWLLPTTAGEEQFDHWLGQAQLMVEESDCSHKEKRRRLMESLRGPALDIVKAARASDPDVSPEDCLEALEHAFGTAVSGEELYFAFRLLQQQPGEKLSDFLRRLEQSLNRVVQRDGLPLGCADKARLEQLLCGAIASDMMLVNLRLRERKATPQPFSSC
ncbi:paraneoplastic antigen Ma1 homolog [Xyrauchen texanus]|uniref:paraneoplastic antigen Ma1 homolog n=1 Tax=Xyrauchen texanus TaxID=154827 RepID=UPI00224250B7|nr:paraneoplastic antigen Ma1 homolog [Xyrauchen texanus]